jgi:hypothetical protein
MIWPKMNLEARIKTDLFSLACEEADLLTRYRALKHTFTTEHKEATYIHNQREKIERAYNTVLYYVDLTEGTTWEILEELAHKASHAQSDEEYTQAEQEFMSRITVID